MKTITTYRNNYTETKYIPEPFDALLSYAEASGSKKGVKMVKKIIKNRRSK